MKKEYLPHKSLFDLDARYIAAACYILPLLEMLLDFPNLLGTLLMILPFFIFFGEKHSEFVRFHALQSFLINFCFLTIVSAIVMGFAIIGLLQFSIIGILALIFDLIVSIGVICLSIYSTIKAFNYWTTDIPLFSKIAHKYAKSSY